MTRNVSSAGHLLRRVLCPLVFAAAVQATTADAAQTDIHGPAGSTIFGAKVAVLPNGNIVVTDPWAMSRKGAVYLYTPAGTLISSFTGSVAGDSVGGGLVVLKNGNFVVCSVEWANGAAAEAGAVTWVDGAKGLSGVVSDKNSLVGSSAGDNVGLAGDLEFLRGHQCVTELSNGNYVVNSMRWSNGAAAAAGAVTWANGNTGVSGAVSAANSLVGSHAGDNVGIGGVIALDNGNYVVDSFTWANGAAMYAGAVTWANGNGGISGPVSAGNSLVGTRERDYVGGGCSGCPPGQYAPTFGGVTALNNGNYVVASPNWANGDVASAGAATWVNGATGLSGAVSATNSLVGTTSGDNVGLDGVVALRNGNYVVVSSSWVNAGAQYAGAVTWGNGSLGVSGAVSPANSLVGTGYLDEVGLPGVTALSNGNYVAASGNWNNGGQIDAGFGAATWADGSVGISGVVSAGNSLVGGQLRDRVAASGVTALTNGNYVVGSSNWSNGSASHVGAATWAKGDVKSSGLVSTANSLVGGKPLDGVGARVTALTNGNYVVVSYGWSNGEVKQAGATTWANGNTGFAGTVSVANSLVGTYTQDSVGSGGVTALSNGNYVVASPFWNDGTEQKHSGAVTWASGSTRAAGPVSSSNSLVGTMYSDYVGENGVTALDNGNYVVASLGWNNGTSYMAGAVSLGSGTRGLTGALTSANSVLGTLYQGGGSMVFAYDPVRYQLIVGQPELNVVSLFQDPAPPPPSIGIDGYMSGNWFDPEQAGHGFQLEAATNNVMLAIWFVYAPDGSGQNWIYAQGTYDRSSNTVTLPAVQLTGARFPPNFLPGEVTQTAWGLLSFSFTDCNHGTATWSSPLPGYGTGSLPITRLTQIAGTSCPP